MSASRIVTFYRGRGRDSRGRYLRDVQQQSLGDLESVHDYIQWMFPLPEPSKAVPGSPVLTPEDIEEFRADQGLKSELLKSFDIMLRFYGFELSEAGDQLRVSFAPGFAARSRVWLSPHNHNFLRLTRILRCLSQLGCERQARALLESLRDLYRHHPAEIGSTALRHWELAIEATPIR